MEEAEVVDTEMAVAMVVSNRLISIAYKPLMKASGSLSWFSG